MDRLKRLAKLQRSATSINQSFRGVNMDAFNLLNQAISHIKSAQGAEKARLASRQGRESQSINVGQLFGI